MLANIICRMPMSRHRMAFCRAANKAYLHSHGPLFRPRYMSSEPPRNDKADIDMNYVYTTMKQWIESYIIDYELCPFAKKSDHRIAIWLHDSVDDISVVEAFMQNEMDKLLKVSDSRKRPNTFIVFPFVQEFQYSIDKFKAFYMQRSSIPRAGSQLSVFDTSCLVQFFPFHMDHNFRFKSPWPTIHLLRKDNLDRVRQGSDKVSDVIAAKNASTLACEHIRRKLSKIVIESAQFPDPITVTKVMCPEQKKRLHEKGIHVIEALVVNGDNDGSNKKGTQIVMKKKRLKGKGKKR